jgi:hypothetical protein
MELPDDVDVVAPPKTEEVEVVVAPKMDPVEAGVPKAAPVVGVAAGDPKTDPVDAIEVAALPKTPETAAGEPPNGDAEDAAAAAGWPKMDPEVPAPKAGPEVVVAAGTDVAAVVVGVPKMDDEGVAAPALEPKTEVVVVAEAPKAGIETVVVDVAAVPKGEADEAAPPKTDPDDLAGAAADVAPPKTDTVAEGVADGDAVDDGVVVVDKAAAEDTTALALDAPAPPSVVAVACGAAVDANGGLDDDPDAAAVAAGGVAEAADVFGTVAVGAGLAAVVDAAKAPNMEPVPETEAAAPKTEPDGPPGFVTESPAKKDPLSFGVDVENVSDLGARKALYPPAETSDSADFRASPLAPEAAGPEDAPNMEVPAIWKPVDTGAAAVGLAVSGFGGEAALDGWAAGAESVKPNTGLDWPVGVANEVDVESPENVPPLPANDGDL